MEKEILKELKKTNGELLEILSSINENQFNSIPFEGSWTAAQVADHIIKFQSGIPALFNGKVEKTTREPGEKIQLLKDSFMDFSTKMKSPDFVKPTDDPLDKEVILKTVADSSRSIQDASSAIDLSMTCLGFELPGTGTMTRLEWLHFILYHVKRHFHQLKNIREKLK